MIDSRHFRAEIIRPALEHLDLWSRAAENLLFGTAAHESHLGTYLRQLNGPALGVFQMEPATYKDIWERYLAYKPHIAEPLKRLAKPFDGDYPPANEMIGNLLYAAAMARIHYLRVPSALPDANDIHGLAHYYKDHYNTYLGSATPQDFKTAYIKCTRSKP